GFTSYSWAPDWKRFRQIADACGAYLIADISHPIGLAIAGYYPNPIGHAHAVMFTTHKTLSGPRGAVILTTREDLAGRIDAAVFPGLQGGPHVSNIAGIAVALAIAKTERYKELQKRIVENAAHLAECFKKLGVRLPYGGTDTHLLLIDLKSITGGKTPLWGEPAARILELAGIVVNKNTIPGDVATPLATGLRLGTPWVSQRGMGKPEMETIARVMHRVLTNIRPFSYRGLQHLLPRGKIPLKDLEEARQEIDALAARFAPEAAKGETGYPHHDLSHGEQARAPRLGFSRASTAPGKQAKATVLDLSDLGLLGISGRRGRALACIEQASAAAVQDLAPGMVRRTAMLGLEGELIDCPLVARLADRAPDHHQLLVISSARATPRLRAWLRALSDGYVLQDLDDAQAKVEGPAVVADLAGAPGGGWLALGVVGPSAKVVVEQAGLLGGEAALGSAPLVLQVPDEDWRLVLVPAVLARKIAAGLTEAGARLGSAEDRASFERRLALPDPEKAALASELAKAKDFGRLFDLEKPYFVGEHALKEIRPRPARKEFAWEEPKDPPLKRTTLFETHQKLTRKIVPFAGWEMPVWYTSTSEEHRAVRERAALFDVSHMGSFEISGPNAASFLDLATTNYVKWLEVGQSQYSYLLDPYGHAHDDVMVYRLGHERFLMVVNASNEDKDWAWLSLLNSGEALLDPDLPARR
ncbi:MAG: hypothetical protein V1750_06440, partial [Acidobacteriota bacterium]